jgi:hypothetical protein
LKITLINYFFQKQVSLKQFANPELLEESAVIFLPSKRRWTASFKKFLAQKVDDASIIGRIIKAAWNFIDSPVTMTTR